MAMPRFSRRLLLKPLPKSYQVDPLWLAEQLRKKMPLWKRLSMKNFIEIDDDDFNDSSITMVIDDDGDNF